MIRVRMLTVVLVLMSISCAGRLESPNREAEQYSWSEVTAAASFPAGYNYPVFVVNGEMRMLNSGGWLSKDGCNWTKTPLPPSGLNSAYQKYVQFNDAVYALGAMEGNYQNFNLSSKIMRTRDLQNWETLAQTSNLPARVFYAALVFRGKIWLLGGWDGKRYFSDAWNSADGVNWLRVAESAPWTPRDLSANAIVFRNQLWLIGGGVVDGEWDPNPGSNEEVWKSAEGISWTKVVVKSPRKLVGNPVVFDGKLWLAGANRGNALESGMLYTDDGANWHELTAPWSPRGAVAVWVAGDRLYLTGGKSSHTENGELKFVYSNDVWVMSRTHGTKPL